MYAYYLWFKAGHIAFMVTWFAGLFYLPRLFIYHSEADDPEGRSRFTLMERRLYAIMTIGAVLTLVFGLLLIAANSALLSIGWFRVKLILLVALAAFHLRCRTWIGKLEAGYSNKDTRGLRWFNEIPALFLLLIVGLAVLKPF
ncbi:MAG: CopD family protein [Gammaproteobacteria bacterium]|nr:CopD family protein [Gammaproteobacteria bacterium]MDH5309340.1 CopD family protein [Gammaproteobacteria bacterium]